MKSRFHQFILDLRNSVVGTGHDFTEGHMGRAIVLLAFPMMLEMAMESLFAIVNIFYVAHLGANAIAAVGITESLLTLVFAVAMGLSMAATATVARRVGEKNLKEGAVAAFQCIVIGIGCSVPIAGIAFFFSTDLLRLMGASDPVIHMGSGYAFIMLSGSATILLLFLLNAVFRGAGDPALAMRALCLANGVNLLLDPCLIFGLGPFPELGVTGSAIATTIGRGTGVIYQLWILFFTKKCRIQIPREAFRIDLTSILLLFRLSIGGIFQYLVATASWVAMMRIVAGFGNSALAAYTLTIRIIVFAILPSWGMSNAAATLVGQNLGAGKPDRAERAVWLAGLANAVFLSLTGLFFIFGAGKIVPIFTSDPAVLKNAVVCLQLVSIGYPFYAYGMVMVQAFNGAGDTFTPTGINLFCYWIFQIPLAYCLSHYSALEVNGIYLAIPIAESLIAVIGIMIFRRGKWKTRVV